MRRLTIRELAVGQGHILSGIIPGEYLNRGGLGFKSAGYRSHDIDCTCKACDGHGRHVHQDDHEVFIILQGKAKMEIDGLFHDLVAGDVIVCEPGEDHHLVSDAQDPCVNIYLHASDQRNRQQHP
jgi:mannose-6-phosphate isomerase-like protein (cupin superfamily)